MAEVTWFAWRRSPVDIVALPDALIAAAESFPSAGVSLDQPTGGATSYDIHAATFRGAVIRAWRCQGRVTARLGSTDVLVRRGDGPMDVGVDICCRFHDATPPNDLVQETKLLAWMAELGVTAGLIVSASEAVAFSSDRAVQGPAGVDREACGEWSLWRGLARDAADAWLTSTKAARLGWAPVEPRASARDRSGDGRPATAPTVDLPSYLAQPTLVVPVDESEAAVDETAALDFSALCAEFVTPALPFVEGASPVAPPRRPEESADHERAETGDETMALPLGALVAGVGGPLGARVAFVPELSVDQYAALVVELEVKGATTEVLRRYGIPTTDALPTLHAVHARRHQADGALFARFEDRRSHFLRFARKP